MLGLLKLTNRSCGIACKSLSEMYAHLDVDYTTFQGLKICFRAASNPSVRALENLPGKESDEAWPRLRLWWLHPAGSGGSYRRAKSPQRLPTARRKRCLAYCARVRIAGEVGALDGLLAEVLRVNDTKSARTLRGDGLLGVFFPSEMPFFAAQSQPA